MQPLKTFIIYAREDRDALLELKKHLVPLERRAQISVWYDGEIVAGEEWEQAIKTNLKSAEIILLLLSSDFFASDYIEKKELKEALSRHDRGISTVVPVIVRHCTWQLHPEIEKLQVLPDNAAPVFSKKHWDDRDEAFANVVQGIARIAVPKQPEKPPAPKQKPRSVSETVQASTGSLQKRLLDALETPPGLPDMIPVTGGTFTMGSPKNEEGRYDNETQHQVILSNFLIGKYPVTIGEYLAFCDETQNHFPEWLEKGSKYHIETGSDNHYKKEGIGRKFNDHPLVGISWDDAQAYCQWLSRKTGQNYRLPTEAEWEYAARGGNLSKGFIYAGSNNIDEVAWYSGNAGSKTHPVGQKKANELGLFDMSGNVWEWCADWFGDYPSQPQTDPTGPESGTNRVGRGGSWGGGPRGCRVACRRNWPPGDRDDFLGFRLAASPQ